MINLILHNESFQEQVDERCLLSLERIQGHNILDEEVLQKVVDLVKLRLHTYKIVSGTDGSF